MGLSLLKAEYRCDEDKCSDYKIGLGALAGVHNTSLHDIALQGAGISTLFSRYNPQYGFTWNLNLNLLNAHVKNAQNEVIAYDKDSFNAFSGYIDTTLFFAKNLKSETHNPFFLGIVVGAQSLFFDQKYSVPSSTLFTLGLGLSGSYMLRNNLAFEYGASYQYGVYGFHYYPARYSPDEFAYESSDYVSLKPNNHHIQAFIGLHKNKLYGLYAKLHLSFTHLDAARSMAKNRYGVSSTYPQALQAMIGLEFGFGFSRWL